MLGKKKERVLFTDHIYVSEMQLFIYELTEPACRIL